MYPTSSYSLYNWASLLLFTLEYGGRRAYMEIHPYYTEFIYQKKEKEKKFRLPRTI
jgi:hypothetical protein